MKILLGESDSPTAMALRSGLRRLGVDVTVASDAVHALNLAKSEHPDVAVLSHKLAGGCVAALGRLRSNVHTSHIFLWWPSCRREARYAPS